MQPLERRLHQWWIGGRIESFEGLRDRVSARRDYQRAHAIYTDIRGRRGAADAYAATELGITELELGDLEAEAGHAAEACRWYRQSAALFDELAARGALRSDSHEEAGKARRAAEACGR